MSSRKFPRGAPGASLVLLVLASAFKRENPCPSTGLRGGSCPGHVVDHIEPLCAGGPDHRSNMQWQTAAEAKVKDREERRICRKGQIAP